jgi:transcriptional regulator with PAS, ATPase and Fis domain
MFDTKSQLNDSLRVVADHRRLNEAIFEASSDGLAILDGQGRFVQVNRAWEHIVGRPRTMLIKSERDTLVVSVKLDLEENGAVRNAILCVRSLGRLNDLKERLSKYEIGDYGKIDEFHAAQLKALLRASGFNDVVLAGQAFRRVLSLVAEIADLDATVLISGETGTGKGLVARLIHRLSRRASHPFIELNCGAIPENLVESELFGYQRGAFTDALRTGKKGQLEAAHGSSLFLDEVSQLPLAAQVKLLKFLDDKIIFPLGGSAPRQVDVRIIAASNTDLRALCAAGKFRHDLYYRLEVIPLTIPPLRERRQEIGPLVEHFVGCFNLEFNQNRTLAPDVLSILESYHYPGNIRELRNLIARLVISARDQQITRDDLPENVRAAASCAGRIAERVPLPSAQIGSADGAISLRRHFQDSEREILEHYARTCRSAREIGRQVGMHHSSVVRKLRKYQIKLGARGGSNP